jgi:carbonic anhydrase
MQMANQMRGSGAGVVVVSCSDPRLNPYQILGIDQTLSNQYLLPESVRQCQTDECRCLGATMVRNAGGRVFDALRTLAVLQTIGAPGTIAVMHHTGMSAVSIAYPQAPSSLFNSKC